MIKSAIFRQMVGGIFVPAALCFASCSFDKTEDWLEPELSSEYVRVGAEVKSHIYSRAEGFTQITEGDFVLTYPYQLKYDAGMPNNIYRLADVKFQKESGGIGFSTYRVPDKTDPVELKWSDVAVPSTSPQTATFYLDNVPDDLDDKAAKKAAGISTNQESREVWFKKQDDVDYYLPFQAGIYEDDYGPNDLLWGSSTATKNDKLVEFVGPENPLHHNMARVKVIIKVQPRTDNHAVVKLSENVVMKITNLKLRPEVFDRTTGILTLPLELDEIEENNTLMLVNMTAGEGVSAGKKSDKTLVWGGGIVTNDKFDENNENDWAAEYTTYDFVLPPQDLINDSSKERPHLVLTIPAEDAGSGDLDGTDVTFEAALPQNMYLLDEKGVPTTRMQLSFMKEHILTIRANIGPPDMKLDFAPVYVEDWVDLGEQPLDGTQDGIYTADDFYNFLRLYVEAIERGTTIRLEKYGYKTTSGQWNILFWGRPELEYTAVENYLLKNLARSIDSTYTPEYVEELIENDKKADEDKDQTKSEELTALKTAVKNLIEENIPFSFAFNNYEIKVTGDGKGDVYSDYSGASGQIRLYKLITGFADVLEPGISTHDEFMAMIKAYTGSGNKQDYGAYDNSEERWVFEIRQDANDSDLEFEYKELKDKMDHNASNSGGNFAINLRNHTITIKFVPDGNGGEQTIKLSGEEGATLLHAILSLPKGIYTLGDVDWLIKAYQSLDDTKVADDGDNGNGDGTPETDDDSNVFADYRWIFDQYGTWNENNEQWTFTYRRTMTLAGPTIYGEMVPDKEKGLPDYVFAIDSGVTVFVSDGGTSTPYLYSPGVADLKKLFAKGGASTTASELKNVITYANNGNPIYRRYYGYYNEEELRWDYPITKSFSIAYTDIFNKLTSPERMEFIFKDEETMVTITGVPGIGDLICRGLQGADILQKIMRGSIDAPEPGIETQGDFNLLFKAYNDGNDTDLSLYGTKNEESGKWTFGFTPTAEEEIVVDYYGDLYNKITDKDPSKFEFSFGDHKLRVQNLPDNAGEIVLSGHAGEVLLRTIVLATGNIMSPEEFTWLINAYNERMATYSLSASGSKASVPNWSSMSSLYSRTTSSATSRSTVSPLADDNVVPDNYKWILGLFGTENEGEWTFGFSGTMTLNGPDIYGQMIPGSGKPQYKFSGAQILVVEYKDDQRFDSPAGNENLRRLLAADGKIASESDLNAMIASAQEGNIVSRRFYGAPDAQDKMTYKLVESLRSIDFQAINGALKEELAADFEMEFANNDIEVELINMPRGYRPIECKGSTGAQTLRTILRGEYPVPVPGIESEEDFGKMITAYGTIPNSDDLWIYGELSGGTWTFYIRNSLTLTGTDIYGKMVSGTDYQFSYVGDDVKVTVTDNMSSERSLEVTEDELKVLMSNGGKVTTKEEFDAMIEKAKNSYTIARRFYGAPDDQSKWIYKIDVKFSAEYNSISGKLASADDFSFSFTDKAEVTVSLPGPRPLVCSDTNGAKDLHDILTGTYTLTVGIKNGEISKLITAYNNSSNTADLAAFGTNSGSKWTFTFLEQMTLTDEIFGAMIPGTEYDFDLNGNTITVSDNGYNEIPTAAELKKLFAATGEITSKDELVKMINGNSITRRYYGKNDGSTWTFPITAGGNIEIAYSEVNGMLKGESFNITLGSGVTVTVGLPGGREVECDASILHDILTGDYELTVGIKNGEISKLITAYNSNTADLAAFGTNSGSKWIFTFLEQMTLNGPDIYGQMIPGTTDYDFNLNGNTITVSDNGNNEIPTAAELKKLFAATGEITSKDELVKMINGNSITRRYYGKNDGSTWTFPITDSIEVTFSEINGQYTTANTIFSFANGGSVRVTGVPLYNTADSKTEDVVFSATAGETAKLIAILDGSYKRSLPDPPTPPTPPESGGDGDDGDESGGGDGDGDGGDDVQP